MIIRSKAQLSSESHLANNAAEGGVAESTIALPDAAFLLHGELSQDGFDLIFALPDGRQHVVHDYFSFSPQPTLFADTGAALSPSLVRSFLPRTFGQGLLFAGPASSTGALVEIGRVTMLVGDVTVRRLDGSEAKLARGDPLFKGDVVITAPGSFVKAELLDGTRFQLGQSAEAAFDDFEFDEAQGAGQFEASVRVGGFYYRSGKIGELDATQTTVHTIIRTPTSIVGVAGSELEGVVDAAGATIIVHRSGILEISDINGENTVTLLEPGNTATVVVNETPLFFDESPPQAQAALDESLPPVDSEAEVDDMDTEEEGVEVEDVDESGADATTADQESEVGSESSEQGLDSEDGEEAENPEGGSDVTDLERPDVGGQLNIFDVIESEFSADTTEQADLQILDTTTNVTFSGVLGFAPLEDVQVQILGVSSNVGISTLLTASSSAVETLQIEEIQIVAPQPLEEIAPSIQAEPTAPPPDNPPIAADDVITLRSSQSIDVTDLLLANDNDPDEGQTLSIVDVSGDQSGNLILSDGRLTVNPDEDLFLGLTEGETVTELFSYTVASADSSATGTVTLVYEGINDSPVISDFLTDIGELAGPTTFLPEDLLAPSFDPDRSDLLSIENVVYESGDQVGLTISEDGSVTVDPASYRALAEGEIEVLTLRFEVVEKNSSGDELSRTVASASIRVVGANNNPVVNAISAAVSEDDGVVALDLLQGSSDLDASNVLAIDNLELVSGDAKGISSSTENSLTIETAAYQGLAAGEASIVEYAFDVVESSASGEELSRVRSSVVITIEGANDSPTIVPFSLDVSQNDAPIVLDLKGQSNDPDATNTLVIENVSPADGDISGFSFNENGDVQLDPSAYRNLGSGVETTVSYNYEIVELNADGIEISRTQVAASVTIKGENDAASISLVLTDAQVTQGTDFDQIARGFIEVSDVDTNQSGIISQAANFGEVTIVDGQFIYVVDPTLNLAEQSTDTIIFTSIDGTMATIDVTIYTENSPSVVNVTFDSDDLSLQADSSTVLQILGNYTLQDAEGGILAAPVLLYGSFAQLVDDQPDENGITSASWAYVLNTASVDVLGLDDGETLTEVLTFRTDDAQDLNGDGIISDVENPFDGDEIFSREQDLIEGLQQFEIVIQGQNDAPVIGWPTLVTDQNDSINLAVLDGLLSYVIDPDNADGSVSDVVLVSGIAEGGLGNGSPVVPGTSIVGRYGTLTVSAEGALEYLPDQLAQAAALENALFVNDEIFTVSVSDGSETAQAELVIEIRNPPPQLISTPLSYVTVSDDLNLSVKFQDFDAFSVQVIERQIREGLPSGLTATLTSDGQTFVGSNLSSATITVINGEVTLSSTNRDWVLGVTADDGDNLPVPEQFILAIRSPEVLFSSLEVYEYFPGESELVAGYAASGLLDVSLWEPEAGDRFVSLTSSSGSVSITLYGVEGVDVVLDSPNTVIFPNNAAQDVVTLTGTIIGLQVLGAQFGDVLIANADIVIGSTPNLPSGSTIENPFELRVGATFSVNSSGDGTQTGFTNASDGVVGVTQAAPVSFDALAVLPGGVIAVVTDDQPAAPVLATGILSNDGGIFLSGQTEVGPDQPVLLQVESTVNQIGQYTQSGLGETTVSSGAELRAESVSNEGLIRLIASLDAGSDALSVTDDQFSVGTLTIAGSYLEDGLLISSAISPLADQTSSYDAHEAPNRISAANFVLGQSGRIRVDHDLSFTNLNQTLDWRQGEVVIAPGSALTVLGGEVILGDDSFFSGYGQLNFGEEVAGQPEALLVSIDGSLNTAQIQGEVNFDGAVTLSSLAGSSQLATLTISPGDELVLAGDDQVNVLVSNRGELEFWGQNNQIFQTLTNTSEGVLEIRLDAAASSSVGTPATQVDFGGTIDNQGLLLIETSQMASSPSSPSPFDDPLTITLGQSGNGPAATPAQLLNAGRWLISEEFGGSKEAFWYGNTDVVTISVDADVTNSGRIELIDGQLIVDGNVSNLGTIEVKAPRSDDGTEGSLGGFDNPRGGQLTILGDLTLAPSSILSLSVGGSEGELFLMGLVVDGQILASATEDAALDLGELMLDFFPAAADDPSSPSILVSRTSLNEYFAGQSAFEWVVSTNLESGSGWSAISSNLPSGYELSMVSGVSDATGLSTASIVVTDGFEVSFDGVQTTTAGITDDVLVLIDSSVTDGQVLSVRSFSVENLAASSSSTPVTLSVSGGGELITSHQSGVFYGQRLVLESSSSSNALLDIGSDLVVAGSLVLGQGSILRGGGSVELAPSGQMLIDAASVDVDIVNSGQVVLASTAASSSGSIFNMGWIIWSPGATSDAAAHVEINNHGMLELQPSSGGVNQYVLSDASITGSGTLGVTAALGYIDNPTLSTEVDLVIDGGALDAAEMTLQLFGPLAGTTTTTLSAEAVGPSVLTLSEQTVFRAIEIDGAVQPAGSPAVLRLDGDWEIRLEGMVELEFIEGAGTVPVVDASSAESVRLVSSSREVAEFINHGTMLLHDFEVAPSVVLANVGGESGTNLDQGRLALSGISLIGGDFYNLDHGQLFVDGEVTISGQAVTDFSSVVHVGASVSVLDASSYAGTTSQPSSLVAPSQSASLTFAQDVQLQGELIIYDLVGNASASLSVGVGSVSGQLNNEGHIIAGVPMPQQVDGGENLALIDAVLSGSGDLTVLGALTLDGQGSVQHQVTGVVSLGQHEDTALGSFSSAATLTLGAGDQLIVSEGGRIVADPANVQTIELVASDSQLVIEGTLDVGGASDGVMNLEGLGTFMLGHSGELLMDANLVSGSSDQLLASSLGTSAPTVHLSGGRLALNLASSPGVQSSVTLIAAPLILGAFASVDGLLIDSGTGLVADIEILTETTSGLDEVNIVAVDPSMVAVGVADTADRFDFLTNANITHFVGDTSATNTDDLIQNIGLGQTAYGEVGDDTFTLASMEFRRIDGGAGIDTVVMPAGGVLDGEGFITFDFRMTTDGQGFWGMRLDRIEVIDLNDGDESTKHRIHLDAEAIAGLIDGGNELIDGQSGIVVRGQLGDQIDLYGDFTFIEDTFLSVSRLGASTVSPGSPAEVEQMVERFTHLAHNGQSIMVDGSIYVVVHEADGGRSQFGTSASEAVTGTDQAETLHGRDGDDVIDGLLGSDQIDGGRGSDQIVFDVADTAVNGGLGIDTLLVSGSIDLSNIDGVDTAANLQNFEVISMAGNETADVLNLDVADVIDWVEDNSLEVLGAGNGHRMLVIRGDAEDQVSLDGIDINALSAIESDIDLFGDGSLFSLFRDELLGIDIYVDQALVSGVDSALSSDSLTPLSRSTVGLLDDMMPLSSDSSDGWM